MDREEAGALIGRALNEHLRLHAQIRALRRQLSDADVAPDLLGTIADLLESHVRFEEQQLFPLIERLIPEDELVELATLGRRDV